MNSLYPLGGRWTQGLTLVAGVVWTFAVFSKVEAGERALQQDSSTTFLRGDANADGTVSLADALFVQSYIFGPDWGKPTCLAAADANDDRRVDIADVIYLLQFLGESGPPPRPPWPEPGLDPGSDETSFCESYLPIPPATDSDAAMQIGTLDADPSGLATLVIAVKNPKPIWGVSGRIQVVPPLDFHVESARLLSNADLSPFNGRATVDGDHTLQLAWDLLAIDVADRSVLPASDDRFRMLLQIELRLDETAASGDYEFRWIEAELVDESGKAVLPGNLHPGILRAGEEPAEGLPELLTESAIRVAWKKTSIPLILETTVDLNLGWETAPADWAETDMFWRSTLKLSNQHLFFRLKEVPPIPVLIQESPQEPRLALERGTLLSWPVEPANYRVQASVSKTGPWQLLAYPARQQGDTWETFVPASNDWQQYRLVRSTSSSQ